MLGILHYIVRFARLHYLLGLNFYKAFSCLQITMVYDILVQNNLILINTRRYFGMSIVLVYCTMSNRRLFHKIYFRLVFKRKVTASVRFQLIKSYICERKANSKDQKL